MKLYPWQKDALKEFLKSENGLLVHLPAGIGKSYILYGAIKKMGGPIFVCSYKYVLYQHKNTIEDEFPDFEVVMIQKGKDKVPKVHNKMAILMTPSILVKKVAELALLNFKLLCFDESQLFKSHNSQRTKIAVEFSRFHSGAKKLLLTATPAPENIGELQPQMEIISPKILGTSKEFRRRYERKVDLGHFWKHYHINKNEIHSRCAPYVYTDPSLESKLPKQTTKTIKLEMTKSLRTKYEEFVEECRAIIEKDGQLYVIVESGNPWIKLLQLCCGFIMGKKTSIWLDSKKIETIKSIISSCDKSDSIIIWGTFREELKRINQAVKGSELLMGGTSKGDAIISRFKNGETRILVANPMCVGVGVSLEKARVQIASSVSPSGCLYYQTINRNRRINQDKNIVRFELAYKDSIDEKLFKLVKTKNTSQSKIMKGVERILYERKDTN